ncbi:MAG TPA: Ig-like domain-containing protein [Acetobacteraceae bacterium]|nr:Ig-like domain-containing protein [Acetobacteraceae bacterium]
MDLIAIRRQPNRRAAWAALALIGAGLQGCAEKPPAPPVQHARLFATDFEGGAKSCIVPKLKLAAGRTSRVAMKVGNDGGWCGIAVARNARPYAVGLLEQPPTHGKVYIHPVGDDTRIDYTPDLGFSGSDSFVVKLLPGEPEVRVSVTVTPK